MIFGCTELKIGPSRAKKSEEFDFEVRLPVQPPKLAQKGETSVSSPKMLSKKNFPPKIDLMGIVRNAFWQSLAPIRTMFEGQRASGGLGLDLLDLLEVRGPPPTMLL